MILEVKPDSSWLEHLQYNPEEDTLTATITDKKGETRRYEYANVPERVWAFVRDSDNVQAVFIQVIRDSYKCTRIKE